MRKRTATILALCLVAVVAACTGLFGCNNNGTNPPATKYTITFEDENGAELLKTDVEEGIIPEFTGTYPDLPEETEEKTFSWEWNKQITAATENTTYKLVLKEKTREYTVKFYDEDGVKILKTATVKYGEKAVAPSAPEKADGSFEGWYTSKEGGDKITDFTVKGNAEYFARYVNAVKYEVIFYDEDGSVLKTESVVSGGKAVAPEAPKKEGDDRYSYTFDGWYTAIDGGEKVTDFTVNGNSYYYIRYTSVLNKYTITFVSEGSVIKEEELEYGATVNLPETTPEKEGYVFAGWDKEIEKVICDEIYTATFGIGLSQADVADFKTILNEKPTETFILTEDLDFGNAQTAGVIDFAGVLNGNGYALKNLMVFYDAREDGWESYLFAENSGTIKNLAVYYTLKANGSKSSLIYENTGIVSNVFVSVTVDGNDVWTLGTIANINDGGTVENCVTVVNEKSGGTAMLGSIVGVDKLSTIKNCYSVTNGKITSDKPNAAENGLGVIEGCANYSTMEELIAGANFDSENGWASGLWRIEDGELLFGNGKPSPKTRILTQADMENFSSIIAENPSGIYELGGDIDFGGAELGISVFEGTLDGKGYSIKNFKAKRQGVPNADSTVTDPNYCYCFIGTNRGVIKNLGIDFVLRGNDGKEGFIRYNEGTVNNIYVKVKMESKGWANAALVGINKGSGKVENVVAVLTKDESVSTGGLGAIVGADYNGTIKNAYGICGDVIPSTEDAFSTPYFEGWNFGTYVNNANYTTMAELAAAITFSAENGWNTEIWKTENGKIVFGK